MIRVGMHEAKSSLSRLVDRVLEGEQVTITRNGAPVAKLVPFTQHAPTMNDVRGIWKDEHVDIGDPFAPLPDWMLDAIEGKDDEFLP